MQTYLDTQRDLSSLLEEARREGGVRIQRADGTMFVLTPDEGTMLREHSRIVVVGTSGAGKTTFARKLANILQRQHIELDSLHWGPHWTVRQEFPELVREVIAADTWIIEGNYSRVRDQIWERATAVVWLNYSFRVVFVRAIARTLRRVVSREVLYSGNQESFRGAFLHRDGIPWWVLRTYSRRRREYVVLLQQPRFRHLTIFELHSPAEALALLESVTA